MIDENGLESYAEYELLYRRKDGIQINNLDASRKLYIIAERKPELLFNGKNDGYAWNENGLAELFKELYIDECRYCEEFKVWYVFDGTCWIKDLEACRVSKKIREYTRLLYLYCVDIENEDLQKEYTKFIQKAEGRSFRDRLIKDCKDELIIHAEEFDANIDLLNLENGTYNLRTNTFYEHDPKDLLTYKANFRYALGKVEDNARFLEFINEITKDYVNGVYVENKEKADFLQRALGYSLLGNPSEECMFILHGKTTRNGKSTLLDAIENLLGDYSTQAPIELICKQDARTKNAHQATPVLAGLKGKRFVTMSESDYNAKLDEGVIKQYTGGEKITARDLYQSSFNYRPQFKLWLSCNDLPQVYDKSLFASNRIKLIEFNRHFKDSEQDKHLKEFLRQPDVKKSIFKWLLDGLKKYREYGLVMSENIKKAVREYERDNNIVLQWLEQCCMREVGNPGTNQKELYESFKEWCLSEGFYVMNSRRFNSELVQNVEWYGEKAKTNGSYKYTELIIN